MIEITNNIGRAGILTRLTFASKSQNVSTRESQQKRFSGGISAYFPSHIQVESLYALTDANVCLFRYIQGRDKTQFF